jgi:cyclopropane fatty-acyl-phospholipid synthase-like methyltransferase
MHRDGLAALRFLLRELRSFLFATPAQKRHFKAGPLHLWRVKRDFQIGFLKEVGLAPEHLLLDIGCGTLRGGIPIIAYLEAGHYYGVESRVDVFNEGTKELKEAKLEDKEPVLINSGDLSSLEVDAAFDFIWAFSVLIHMTDEIVADCLRFVERHLKSSGWFYANVSIGRRGDATLKWQGFPIVTRSWEFYEELGSRNGLHPTDMGTLESLNHISGISSIDDQHMLRFHRV